MPAALGARYLVFVSTVGCFDYGLSPFPSCRRQTPMHVTNGGLCEPFPLSSWVEMLMRTMTGGTFAPFINALHMQASLDLIQF